MFYFPFATEFYFSLFNNNIHAHVVFVEENKIKKIA